MRRPSTSLFECRSAPARLASIVSPNMFTAGTVAATNLFEMNCSRVPVRRGEHEHHVVPDRSRGARVRSAPHPRCLCALSFAKGKNPGFSALQPSRRERAGARCALLQSGRLPRRRTSQELRAGAQSGYPGSELFLSLSEPAGVDDTERVRELSVRCLASNRHLAEQLPVGEAGADFFLLDDTSVPLHCVAGPTTAARIAGRNGASASRHGAFRRDGLEAHQFPVAQPSRADRPRRKGPGRRAARNARAVHRPFRNSVRAADPRNRERLQPADRAAAAPEERLQRRARHRDHRHASTRRRSRARASSCSAPSSTGSLPNTPRSTALPKR